MSIVHYQLWCLTVSLSVDSLTAKIRNPDCFQCFCCHVSVTGPNGCLPHSFLALSSLLKLAARNWDTQGVEVGRGPTQWRRSVLFLDVFVRPDLLLPRVFLVFLTENTE